MFLELSGTGATAFDARRWRSAASCSGYAVRVLIPAVEHASRHHR